MDKNLDDVLAKTFDTTSGGVLNYTLLSSVLSEQVRRQPVLRNFIKRVPFHGKTYLWDIVTNEGDAYTAADQAALTLIDPALVQGSVSMSYFYYPFQISNPLIATTSELLDVVKMRMNQAMRALIRKEGSFIFNGDPVLASNWNGLYNALVNNGGRVINNSSPTQISQAMMTQVDVALRTDGYSDNLVWVMSPAIYAAIQSAMFAKGTLIANNAASSPANFGYELAQGQLYFHGVLCLADPFAATVTQVASETVTITSKVGTLANRYAATVASTNGTDTAGRAKAAPVVRDNGTVKAVGTDYSWSQDAAGTSTLTFVNTPTGPVTVTYAYEAQNVYLLSLNEADLVIPVALDATIEENLGAPVLLDAKPLRAKQYSSMVVRNPQAHAVITNVYAPNTPANF